jgi:hypothetical protein
MRKNQRYLLFLLSLTIFFPACGGKKTDVRAEELATLKTEVFAVHDQIMPETMNTIPQLKDSLNSYISKVKPTRADSARKMIARLDSADQSMNAWMKQYDGEMLEKKDMSLDEKMAYMQKQKEMIVKVRKLATEGIQEANQLLMVMKMPATPNHTLLR